MAALEFRGKTMASLTFPLSIDAITDASGRRNMKLGHGVSAGLMLQTTGALVAMISALMFMLPACADTVAPEEEAPTCELPNNSQCGLDCPVRSTFYRTSEGGCLEAPVDAPLAPLCAPIGGGAEAHFTPLLVFNPAAPDDLAHIYGEFAWTWYENVGRPAGYCVVSAWNGQAADCSESEMRAAKPAISVCWF